MMLRRARGAGGREAAGHGAGDVNSGETVAVGAEKVAEVTSYEEVGAVHGGVAVGAEKCGIGRTIERSLLIAKLATFLHLRVNVDFKLKKIL